MIDRMLKTLKNTKSNYSLSTFSSK